jgi:mono/diheme cytochrome c family protein
MKLPIPKDFERYVTPEEIKRLFSALLVVTLFIALAAVFAFIVVPGMRNANRPSSANSLNPPAGEWGWLAPTEFPKAAKYTVPPIDPATVMTPNPELLARGKAVYLQTCASCHGANGAGDGPAGQGLAVKPRQFTADGGWKNGARITDIYKTLEEGLKGSSMVSYSYLSRKDRMALVHVVQSFGGFAKPPEDPKALEALAKSFAAAGEEVPNRIPVSLAVLKLCQEYQRPTPFDFPGAVQDPIKAAEVADRLSRPDATQALSAGLGRNGFAPRVATWEPAEWTKLDEALKNRREP